MKQKQHNKREMKSIKNKKNPLLEKRVASPSEFIPLIIKRMREFSIADELYKALAKVVSTEDLNATYGSYGTAIYIAAHDDDIKTLKLLLDLGASPEVEGNGRTPLHWAACRGNAEAVELLLRAGAYVDPKSDILDSFETPLHWAVRYGRVKCVEVLLKYGADVNMKNAYGNTPLHKAAGIYDDSESKATVDILLKYGADPFAENSNGYFPFEFDDRYKKYGQSHSYLVEKTIAKFDEIIKQENIDQDLLNKILRAMVKLNDVKRVKQVLDKGADPFAEDKNGDLVYSLTNNQKIKELIKSATKK